MKWLRGLNYSLSAMYMCCCMCIDTSTFYLSETSLMENCLID